jgi:hypothetical protein
MCVQDADLSLPLFMGVDGMADYMFVVDNGELRVLFSLAFFFFRNPDPSSLHLRADGYAQSKQRQGFLQNVLRHARAHHCSCPTAFNRDADAIMPLERSSSMHVFIIARAHHVLGTLMQSCPSNVPRSHPFPRHVPRKIGTTGSVAHESRHAANRTHDV